jgi:ATP-dependent RNA helicase DDX56/DBP9
MQKVPTTCQSFLVSATLSPELENFRQVVLHNPALVQLEEEENKTKGTPKLIQFYLPLPKKDKNLVLYVFLKLGLLRGKGLLFVNSVDAGYRLKLFLQQFHIHSAVWNAELPLSSRMHTMEQFNVGNIDYLILTDEARGMDFYRVSFVVNVELPETPTDYIHRVGRTARAGAKGVALTLIDRDSQAEWDALTHIQASQPRLPTTTTQGGLLQPFRQQEDETTEEDASSLIQPSPLDFDLQEVEGFRYRVEDVQRAVTKVAVQEARAQELKAEILNSERLSHHFAEHPADLQLLQHDRMTNQHQPLQHLSHVPKYLLPRGMQVADLHKRRRKKRVRLGGGERRTDNDPLQAFDAPETVDDMMLEDDKKQVAAKPATEADRKIYANAQDGTGKSTSGRKAWQAKHKVGKFSNKRRKNEPKRRRVGI